MLSKKWQELIIILVFLSTSIVGFFRFADFSLDVDELFNLTYAKNIVDFNYLNHLNGDLGNPPLFVFLLKPWAAVSESEIWLRLLPFFFYFLSVLVFKKLLKLLSNSIFIQTTSMLLFLGVGAYLYLRFNLRAYSLLLLTALLTIQFTFKILSEKNGLKNSLILIAIMTVGINSHYIYWLFLGFWLSSLFAVSIKNKIDLKIIKQFFFSIFASLVINAPLFINLIKRELLEKNDYSYYWWQLDGSRIKWMEIWEIFFKFSIDQNLSEIFGYSTWLIVFISIILTIKKSKNLNVKLLLFFLNLFWMVYLITPIGAYLPIQKYIALFIALLTASVPIIIEQWQNIKIKQDFFYTLSMFILVTWSIFPLPLKHRVNSGEDWRSVIKMIEKKEVSYALVIDCWNLLPFEHYAKRETLEKIYGSIELPAKNKCDLKPINSQKFEDEEIILLTVGHSHSIDVGKNYQVSEVESEKYWPISITAYEKKHE